VPVVVSQKVLTIMRLDKWCTALLEDAWAKSDVRDSERGPLEVEAVERRVQGRTKRSGSGSEKLLFVTRERRVDNTFKPDYYLSSAGADVALKEFARMANAAHRVERAFRASKSGSRLRGLSGEDLDSLASSPNAVAASRVVPEQGRRGGGKILTLALTFAQLRRLIAGLIDAYLRASAH